MKLRICHDGSNGHLSRVAKEHASELVELGFDADCSTAASANGSKDVCIRLKQNGPGEGRDGVSIEGPETLLERTLRALPLDFDSLPLVVEGESKIIRKWTEKVVAIRFKPTVYSFTANRYGEVPGSDRIRLKFTAALFRLMAARNPDGNAIARSAFLAERESDDGPLLIEKNVETCNLEIRVKRYHIGSPLHRYRYTEKYPTRHGRPPLARWSRLDPPVVCFDWRHPLVDDEQKRLADEPLPDDYAALWIDNLPLAKKTALQLFLWMESVFEAVGLRLVDVCLFIDRTGQTIYGEISPDCMRVRLGLGDPSQSEAADKDLWRGGRSPEAVLSKYEELYHRLFSNTA